jgi:predicted DNA-binding protein
MREIVKQTLLTPEEADRLENIAKIYGQTVSSWLRDQVVKEIEGLRPPFLDATDYILRTLPDFEMIEDMVVFKHSGEIVFYTIACDIVGDVVLINDSLVKVISCFNERIEFDHQKVELRINELYKLKLNKNDQIENQI